MTPSRDTSPSAYQEVFVNELRARREAEGLSRNKLAATLGCTPQWIAKVETFEKPPSEGLADDLDTYYQADGMFRRIWEKHVEARKIGLIPVGFRPLTEVEKLASQLCIFAPLVVPGLLQTEEHARLVLKTEHLEEKAEELVALRMERQAVFAKPNPPWLFVLLREAVLRDLPGEIRNGQYGRLLDMLQRSNFCIQLIPSGFAVTQSSGFQLLSFSEAPDIAYVDGACGHGQVILDPGEVHRIALSFNVIRATALSAGESEGLIRKYLEGA
ncbi:helix-turn-helix domain-containing protein [Actinomadura graeca]|uniref:Helix-turn-helix domain-containing protein n=1 Tax=Actinomadura graeca TaxID=2750812 RepID=A0ABX8R0B9_9ACTN|nr:helix-turn-helix transcriptional regulator [Actinomadura graeca]QXJ24526.1 helix-turn-helix domain-containing protein [Actinomadura graeca]